ncbi:hypothetical protein QUF63_14660 [Anaerolineales bacterium HSG25]|nr:hypothetical protein [Anaerolineales bacterium HSG25]
MIILISSNKQLVKTFMAALSESNQIVCMATYKEARAMLLDSSDSWSLLVLDATQNAVPRTLCEQICSDKTIAHLPLMAIIAHPKHRQAVLEAGVDDYLLYPLLPAEIQARLHPYLHTIFCGIHTLTDVINQLSLGTISESLSMSLRHLAMVFGAYSIWLSLIGPPIRLVAKHCPNNSPLMKKHEMLVQDCVTQWESHQAQPMLLSRQQVSKNKEIYHLSIPLYRRNQLIGLLSLVYLEKPRLSRSNKRWLVMLGQDASNLLEAYILQQETHTYATQTAFILLLSQIINETLDRNRVLGQLLEQTIDMVNGAGGGIWLPSEDGEWLDLASSLSSSFAPYESKRRAKGQGFVGWVVENGKTLYTETPSQDERFDKQVDRIERAA